MHAALVTPNLDVSSLWGVRKEERTRVSGGGRTGISESKQK